MPRHNPKIYRPDGSLIAEWTREEWQDVCAAAEQGRSWALAALAKFEQALDAGEIPSSSGAGTRGAAMGGASGATVGGTAGRAAAGAIEGTSVFGRAAQASVFSTVDKDAANKRAQEREERARKLSERPAIDTTKLKGMVTPGTAQYLIAFVGGLNAILAEKSPPSNVDLEIQALREYAQQIAGNPTHPERRRVEPGGDLMLVLDEMVRNEQAGTSRKTAAYDYLNVAEAMKMGTDETPMSNANAVALMNELGKLGVMLERYQGSVQPPKTVQGLEKARAFLKDYGLRVPPIRRGAKAGKSMTNPANSSWVRGY